MTPTKYMFLNNDEFLSEEMEEVYVVGPPTHFPTQAWREAQKDEEALKEEIRLMELYNNRCFE
ncbi:hypothetical protein SCRM01_162c [Synechococcus phage S-CRM01]|uniref:hypothetical protein n=1 Tax=Synechococcus phage S-CRM01 TaxID=1026955 RepID=UPI000209E3F3|nr:hypothetical protein SCRM01_162c [Synechococcus phage S-CRM01]AEC53108.1 hypothetical protein SCRM01_162c [Synechococcus phage S-CRM01]